MEAYKHFVGPNCNYLKKTEQQAKKIFSLPNIFFIEKTTEFNDSDLLKK